MGSAIKISVQITRIVSNYICIKLSLTMRREKRSNSFFSWKKTFYPLKPSSIINRSFTKISNNAFENDKEFSVVVVFLCKHVSRILQITYP